MPGRDFNSRGMEDIQGFDSSSSAEKALSSGTRKAQPDNERKRLYSSVVERQSCKLKVLGSIPSGGCMAVGLEVES